jgi:hypothetical protein
MTQISWTYNKYKNKWTEYNGVKYQSQKEALYAQELDLLLKAKKIVSWNRQIKMPIEIDGVHICNYVCDFEVLHPDGKVEYIDVKGMRSGAPYQLFKLKKKLVEAIYNIELREV